VDTPGASQHEQMKSRRHFGGLANPGEIGRWPWAAETQRLRRSAIEVAHVRGKRLVASVKCAWQSGTEHAEIFLRRVNRDAGVDPQQLIQAAGVIAVAVGDNGEVELRQVDTLGRNIVRKDLGIVAGVKQNALAAIGNERGKSPILLHCRGLAKGIVENRNLTGAR